MPCKKLLAAIRSVPCPGVSYAIILDRDVPIHGQWPVSPPLPTWRRRRVGSSLEGIVVVCQPEMTRVSEESNIDHLHNLSLSSRTHEQSPCSQPCHSPSRPRIPI